MIASFLNRLKSISILSCQMIFIPSIFLFLCYIFYALTKAYTWIIPILIKAMNVGNMNHTFSLILFFSAGK